MLSRCSTKIVLFTNTENWKYQTIKDFTRYSIKNACMFQVLDAWESNLSPLYYRYIYQMLHLLSIFV